MITGKHGITTNTPGSILLGAGTYHKNLTFSAQDGWTGDCIGATTGGGKVTIKGEFMPIELDGALVRVKGLTVKQGGTATMEVNYAEITPDSLKTLTLMKEETTDAAGFTMLVDKANIEEGDYLENFGFVGFTADGKKQIVIIFESALCTSGLEMEPKDKANTVVKATLEAHAEIGGDLDTLPVKIYMQSVATV